MNTGSFHRYQVNMFDGCCSPLQVTSVHGLLSYLRTRTLEQENPLLSCLLINSKYNLLRTILYIIDTDNLVRGSDEN